MEEEQEEWAEEEGKWAPNQTNCIKFDILNRKFYVTTKINNLGRLFFLFEETRLDMSLLQTKINPRSFKKKTFLRVIFIFLKDVKIYKFTK